MTVKRGIHPASKRPKKKRAVIAVPKSEQAAKQAAAIPQPKIIVGMRIRAGTFTTIHAEKGCHPSWAIGEIDPMREY